MATPLSRTRRSAFAASLTLPLLGAALALSACVDLSAAEPKGPALHELHLDSLLHESPEHAGFGGGEITHHALLTRLAELTQDADAKGLLLRVDSFGGGFSRAQDLVGALEAFRAKGKPVHCYFEGADNASYLVLARACDRISMTPAGMLDLVGVAGEFVFARELLATVGVQADLIQVGRFKGAADMFTRDSMAPEVRETSEAMIDDLQSALIASIAAGRKLAPERVREIIDQGPFSAERARELGLVDAVAFDDEARAHAKEAAKVERVERDSLRAHDEPSSVFDLISALSDGGEHSRPKGPRIALAYLDGTIADGGDDGSRSAHAGGFVKAMRKLADEEDVRAVVLRIESPGGSALASDVMWHAVRRVAKRKPVIVSIGDLAASGGYYVASAGTRIFARDESLVGSIGVLGGKVVLEDLSRRAGVHAERIGRGARSGWSSSMRPFSEDERTVIAGLLESTYTRFLSRVSEGRGKTPEQLAPMVEGRLMSGRRAREGGLVDAAGGLEEAIADARAQTKLGADSPIEIWPEEPNLMQQIARFTGGPSARVALAEQVLPAALWQGLAATLLAGGDPQMAVLPFAMSLR